MDDKVLAFKNSVGAAVEMTIYRDRSIYVQATENTFAINSAEARILFDVLKEVFEGDKPYSY